MIRTLPLLLLLLTGCKRDPQFYGIWQIDRMERDGVKQDDAGFFEIVESSDLVLFLRYEWTGTEFLPDPDPVVQFGTSDAQAADDIIEAYKQKDEEYTLTLSFWGLFDVDDYTGSTAKLHGTDTTWPGRPEDELGDTKLLLSR